MVTTQLRDVGPMLTESATARSPVVEGGGLSAGKGASHWWGL